MRIGLTLNRMENKCDLLKKYVFFLRKNYILHLRAYYPIRFKGAGKRGGRAVVKVAFRRKKLTFKVDFFSEMGLVGTLDYLNIASFSLSTMLLGSKHILRVNGFL